MRALKERLADGEIIILDGAIGTELQRMGVPMHGKAWCAEALKTHPDTVRQLHEDYVRADADVITVDTFSSASYVLEGTEMEGEARVLNTKAVDLAREACDNAGNGRDIHVAGVLSRFGLPGDYSDEQMRAAFDEHSQIQADAGVDLMLLEFLGGPLRAIVQAAHAAKATGLPVWVAIAGREEENGTVLLGGRDHPSSPREDHTDKTNPVRFTDAIDEVMAIAGDAFLVLHSEVRDTGPALKAAREVWDGPLGAYSHSGDWITPNWQFINMISPENYLAEAKTWVDDYGMQIVGGCCGIGMQHIELLRPGLSAKVT